MPVYKGKGDKYGCDSYRGIRLMSEVGKVYGRVFINWVRQEAEAVIGEKQCRFRMGRGCVDQTFVVRQLCEECLAEGREVYPAFMDLEKAYDRVERRALWQMVRIFEVEGNCWEYCRTCMMIIKCV